MLKVFAILSVLLLGGCAGQVNMLPTLSEQTILQPDRGIVVVRVINASAYRLPFNQLTITPENINESKHIKPERLLSLRPQMNGSTVFSSPVKAGSYALSSIRAFHSRGDYWYSRFVSADAKFGTFEVKPGLVTDLGSIIYYPKSQDDKYIDTLLRLPESEPGEVLDKYFPFYGVNKGEILGWNIDEHDEERESNYVSTAQNPITYDLSYLAPDKSVYFLGKLGVIIKRTASGEWELDAVETNLDLTTIAQNQQGDLIVGGSEGRLFWKPAGKVWLDISLSHDYQIEKLLFYDDNTVDMLAKQNTKLTVFRTNVAQRNIVWQEMDHYTSLKGWKSTPLPVEKNTSKRPKRDRRITGVALSTIGQSHYLTVRTLPVHHDPIFSDSKSETFGYDANTWQLYSKRQALDVSSIVNAGAIKLGIKKAGFWSWDGKPKYLRYVEGSDSWEEISTYVYKCKNEITQSNSCGNGGTAVKSRRSSFKFRAIPWFKNDLEAVAIVSFSDYDFWSGKRSSKTKVLSTDNGGKSWSDSGSSLPQEYCSGLVPEVVDRLLVSCNGASGDFYESLDDGASWQHVRQHENF